MAKPVMILVHGAWHTPEFYDRVIPILESLGYRCVTVDLPAVDSNPPVATFDEDIAVVRNAVLKELDAGHDVVVNAHSWGAVPTNSALDGLSKLEREKEGKSNSVVKLTFVAAFVLPAGVTLEEACGGPVDWWIIADDNTFMPNGPEYLFYNDLEPEDAAYWASLLKPHSLATIQGETARTRSAACMKIPSVYMACELDNAVPVEAQEAIALGVRKEGAVIEIERVSASHSPHLSKPEVVADFMHRAASSAG